MSPITLKMQYHTKLYLIIIKQQKGVDKVNHHCHLNHSAVVHG